MKHLRWLIPLLLVLACATTSEAQTYNPVSGWCEDGNRPVVTGGISSTTRVQASYPLCTVTVIVHGGGAATIYSDSAGTPLANPFTASTNGHWQFFAAAGLYDATLTGGTPAFPAPVTISSLLSGPGVGVVTSFSAGNLSPLFTSNVANPTSTPALTFSLSNAAANTVFGRCTGTMGAPSYCSLTAAMLPTLGSDTTVIYNSAGTLTGSTLLTWDNVTKTLAVNGATNTPAVRLVADAGGAKQIFGSGTLPYIQDLTGAGWQFRSQAAQDILFGPSGDPTSFVMGGDGSEAHGVFRAGIGANNGVIKLNDGSSSAGTFLGPQIVADTGTPEGNYTARIGSLFMRADGGAGTALYVKQTGTGNTGWSALSCLAGSAVCSATVFSTGDGSAANPSYTFTNAATTGWYWSGTQACLSLATVSQLCTNGGPGITSSGSICTTTTTRCFNSGTATTSLEPYIQTTGGAIMLAMPKVAGDVTTTGWGTTEDAGVYFNTTSNIMRYWDGSALDNLTLPLYNGTGTKLPSAHAVIASCTLGTDCAITLTGASVFTSNTSYKCSALDTTAAAAIRIQYTSGSQFTLTGTGTDVLHYMCIGN